MFSHLGDDTPILEYTYALILPSYPNERVCFLETHRDVCLSCLTEE